MKILDGTKLSQKNLKKIKKQVSKLKVKPNLDIILIGNDPASIKYVQMKQKTAAQVGIGGEIYHLEKSTTQAVLNLINKLNKDSQTTALMVQLPLPKNIDTNKVLSSIDPQKDADGLNPFNLGLLLQKKATGIPSATALGIINLLENYRIPIKNKNIVIVGRSPEVSLPLFALLMQQNATVTICHTFTKNLKSICSQADILISAIGKPNFFTKDFIKPKAVIIDVGFAVDPKTNKVTGDFDFNEVSPLTSFITPVPGGVGPMTITSLLQNTLLIALKNN